MHPDDEVCLCFRVSLRKVRTFLARENPPVVSLVSECLGAGTGCGWCVPFLKHLHRQHQAGQMPDLKVSPEQYAQTRLVYKKDGQRDEAVLREAVGEAVGDERGEAGDERRDEPPGRDGHGPTTSLSGG